MKSSGHHNILQQVLLLFLGKGIESWWTKFWAFWERVLDTFIFKSCAIIVDNFWRNPSVCGNLHLSILAPHFEFIQWCLSSLARLVSWLAAHLVCPLNGPCMGEWWCNWHFQCYMCDWMDTKINQTKPAICFLKFGTWWRWVVSLMLWLLYLPRRGPHNHWIVVGVYLKGSLDVMVKKNLSPIRNWTLIFQTADFSKNLHQ